MALLLKFQLFRLATFLSQSESEGGGGGGGGVDFFGLIEGIQGIIDKAIASLGQVITEILLTFFQTQALAIFEWVTGLVLTLSTEIFEQDLIMDWFSMISILAKMCFVVGLTLYVANNCIKMSAGGRALMVNDLKTYILYLAFGWFGVDGSILIFREINSFLASGLGGSIVESSVTDAITTIGIPNGAFIVATLVTIIFTICMVSFFISVVKRIGYIFALVSVIPVYMLAFGKGYSSGFFSWLRMFASCCLTFFLQYVMFYMGMNLLISNSFVLSLLMFISLPVVPMVLGQFGSGTTTMGDIIADVSNTAKQGASMATHLAGA